MGNFDATIPATREEIPASPEETLAAWFLEQAGSCCREGDVLELGPTALGASRFCREGESYLTPDLSTTDWKALRNEYTKRFRFVHLMATGGYDELLTGIETVRFLLRANGIFVISGYRTGDNPASAAAVWQSVLAGTLRPICTTRQRFYGMWGDAGPIQNELLVWMAGHVSGYAAEVHNIARHRLLHLNIT
ncbi:hypothetical protein SMC26_34605 [Actinomadura fulvescens]|uniref:Uncharacterized protein n=1 Tax=Actinomadura fulvescens TaxID=46160 RepID=A0ABN3QUX2_9ACTN